MDLNNLSAGDKVRVTLDLEVGYIDVDDEIIFKYDGNTSSSNIGLYPTSPRIVSVELQAAPPKVFGPGDLVRDKRVGANYLILAVDGRKVTYFSCAAGSTATLDDFVFDEAGYELVTSVEAAQ